MFEEGGAFDDDDDDDAEIDVGDIGARGSSEETTLDTT